MSPLSTHPFWHELAAARRAGRPTAWTRPMGTPLATPDQVFEALLEVARRRRENDAPLTHRLFADRKSVAIDDALLPERTDVDMRGYVARLDAALGETGFVVNDFQAADPTMWRLATGVCAGLRGALGLPPAGGSFDLFSGAYRSGFFGVHKDDQEVVTFIIEGKKRFLLWPYEVLKNHPKVPPHAERKPVLLDGFDYSALRAEAIVLEGGPGDVFYWPVDFWHVAESDGELATTVGVGFFAGESPAQVLGKAVQELVDEGVLPAATDLPAPEAHGGDASALLRAAQRRLDEALAHPAVAERVCDKLLQASTSFGFRTMPRQRDAHLAERHVRLADPALLAWAERGDELAWSVGGAIFRYPALPALRTLFEALARGEVIDVIQAAEERADAIEPAAFAHVIDLLARHHGLEAATRPVPTFVPVTTLAAAYP